MATKSASKGGKPAPQPGKFVTKTSEIEYTPPKGGSKPTARPRFGSNKPGGKGGS